MHSNVFGPHNRLPVLSRHPDQVNIQSVQLILASTPSCFYAAVTYSWEWYTSDLLHVEITPFFTPTRQWQHFLPVHLPDFLVYFMYVRTIICNPHMKNVWHSRQYCTRNRYVISNVPSCPVSCVAKCVRIRRFTMHILLRRSHLCI